MDDSQENMPEEDLPEEDEVGKDQPAPPAPDAEEEKDSEAEPGETPDAGEPAEVAETEEPAAIAASDDDRTMGMLCHLLGIFTGFLGPLIIWLVKKDDSDFVDDQGKEALNFQLTLLIAYIISFGPLNLLFCIGSIIGMVIWIVALIFSIMATVRAKNGELYRYPINIRMIK